MPPNQPMDRTIPADLDAEMALLGAVMINADLLDDVVPIIRDRSDFTLGQHQVLWDACLAIRAIGVPLDLVTLADYLRMRNQFDQAGGHPYMIQLAESFAETANAPHYARIIRRHADCRRLIRMSDQLREEAYSPLAEPSELSFSFGARVAGVGEEGSDVEAVDARQVVRELWREQQSKTGQKPLFVPTGVMGIDINFGGLEIGAMTIIAARPSVGKSAFAAFVADHVVVQEKRAVYFASLEMRSERIAARLASLASGIETQRLLDGTAESIDVVYQQTLARLPETPNIWLDTHNRKLSAITAAARSCVRKKQAAVIIVDFIQLVDVPTSRKDSTRNDEIGAVARGLQRLARETETAVLVCCQLSRKATERGQPKLTDLRDSGEIEQCADVVWFLHPTSKIPQRHQDMAVLVKKNRNGATGQVDVVFDKTGMAFLAGRVNVEEEPKEKKKDW